MGGPCDAKLTADTREEMVQKMTKHVMENHPETAKEMEAMHKRDPNEWGKKFREVWDNTMDS
jgi:hypothetical protein